MPKRPPIPSDIERAVLVEAGHRCAIPTCRQAPVEIAHITPWRRCREHVSDNLIALCPTCHTRFDRGEIDRPSMLLYKHRLKVISGRYTTFEHRVLQAFAKEPTMRDLWLLEDLRLLIAGLLEDGILAETEDAQPIGKSEDLKRRRYRLTSRGRKYVWTCLQ